MSVWMENVTINQFEVCLRESRALDGGHNKIAVVSDEFMKIISLPMRDYRHLKYAALNI